MCRRISRVLRHCWCCYYAPFPATSAGRIAGQLVVVAGSLVDDTVLSIAQGTGKPDNIPGPCSCNFRFYGLVFHWIIDLVVLCLAYGSGLFWEIRSSIQEGFKRILSRKILARDYRRNWFPKSCMVTVLLAGRAYRMIGPDGIPLPPGFSSGYARSYQRFTPFRSRPFFPAPGGTQTRAGHQKKLYIP